MIRVHSEICGPLENNVYLLWDELTLEAALIDPAIGSEGFVGFARGQRLLPKYILNTHAHVDHIWNNALFKREWDVPLVLPRGDEGLVKRAQEDALSMGLEGFEPVSEADAWCQEGDEFLLGSEKVKVLATPGHTPGHVSFLTGAGLFCGDVLFQGGVGRWDLPGGDGQILFSSIRERLFVLPESTVVFPGHGPPTTIGEEKHSNPYVGENAMFAL